MLEVQRQIRIPSSPDLVWRVISDPAAVVTCLPGASLEGDVVDGAFAGRLTVAFGGLRVPFKGSGKLELDEPNRVGKLTGQGRDNNGGTRFQVATDFAVSADGPGHALVEVNGHVDLAGKLAPLIEAGAEVVMESMLKEFTKNLTALCSVSESRGDKAATATSPIATAIPARVWLKALPAVAAQAFRGVVRALLSKVRRAT
jgi:carbon monoxide dehydrogenase subunit G